mmetsp:Transcript_16837/g.23407  ORF Transcript_16837/g.23407 Transcript_16837/m.23407 type:complete len:99 (-) Transcript_16837:725-1021(-)
MVVKVPDPYEALGLPHDASQAQIKLAYRKLALEYHPDQMTRRSASDEETKYASDRFAAISAAYQLLSDPRKKNRVRPYLQVWRLRRRERFRFHKQQQQ